jgi:hypothetical protein
MTKQEIIQKLSVSYQDFAQYATSLSEGDFLFAAPEKWSAGRQVHHLISSVSPLALAMKLPFFVLKFMFGRQIALLKRMRNWSKNIKVS